MRIGIITCPRDGHVDYLNPTIASMLQKDPTVLCSDIAVFSDNSTWPSVKWPVGLVEPLSAADEKAREKDKAIIIRPYTKALNWIAEGDDIGIVAEDDIKCAHRWSTRARGLAEVCETLSDWHKLWVMPLMHFYDFSDFEPCGLGPSRAGATDMLVRWKSPEGFYGTQCVMFSRTAARNMRENFATYFDDYKAGRQPWYMSDILIGRIANKHNIPMLSPHPNLVQHVGEQTVACKGRKLIQTRYFEE